MKRCLAVSLGLIVTWSLAAIQATPPTPAKSADSGKVRELVKQLDSPRFAVREQADKALRAMGVAAVPLLREELKTAGGLESRRRVERIIAELTTLPWHRDVAQAITQAQTDKKPILVFSTMGEPSGFAWLGSNLMRTVTFADLSVIDDLKQHFVLLWHNQSVDAFAMEGVQQKYTPEQVKAYPEGGGGGNVRTYFCTSDGKVLYYLQGFWRDQRYRAEADFARQLSARAASPGKEDPALAVRKALIARQSDIADLQRQLRERYPEEFKKKVYESEIHKRHAALGLIHNNLTAHNDLAMRQVQPILVEIWRQNVRRGEFRWG